MISWYAEDGLMRLDIKDDRDPFEGQTLRTVHNANGIYYLAVNYMLRKIDGESIKEDAEKVNKIIKRLEHKPGLYLRRPGWTDATEAHDNYLGICALSHLLKLPFPHAIVAYGMKTGWNFDHTGKGGLRTTRQGGEVAVYKMCAGYKPAIWEWIWLCGGFITAAFSSRKSESDTQLQWLRAELVEKLVYYNIEPWWTKLSWKITKVIWRWRSNRKFGNLINVFEKFYPAEGHPNKVLARKLLK